MDPASPFPREPVPANRARFTTGQFWSPAFICINHEGVALVHRRLALLAVLTPAGTLLIGETRAQRSGKVAKVGRIHPGNEGVIRNQASLGAFRAAMRDLGWIEGQNLRIEHRWAEGDPQKLKSAAQELVQSQVDVLVAVGDPGIAAARQATASIPIVMAASADAKRSGFVRDLARPEANATGLTLESQDLQGKRLELLKEAVPGLRRVAILSNPAHRAHADYLREAEDAARALGIQTVVVQARQIPSVLAAVQGAVESKVDAMMILSDPLVLDAAAPQINVLARKHHLPTLYAWRQLAEEGGLLSYGADLSAIHGRAAFYVDRLLKGSRPADLPVEQPTRFEFVVNLKTAMDIGLKIPQSVLLRADHVVR